jgi:tRNA(Arg) A34 adenosine deaminase TadA
MWSELSRPWQAALEQAWLASLEGCLPIGAVIVSLGGDILATGRNQIRNTVKEGGQVFATSLAHAEINALLAYHRPEPDPHENILYTTMEPCPMCMGAVYMSGIRTLHFACADAWAGSTNMIGTTPYLSQKPFHIVPPQHPLLASVLLALHTEAVFLLHSPVQELMLEVWECQDPDGYQLGQRLHVSGELQRWRDEHLSASEVMDRLAEQIYSV